MEADVVLCGASDSLGEHRAIHDFYTIGLYRYARDAAALQSVYTALFASATGTTTLYLQEDSIRKVPPSSQAHPSTICPRVTEYPPPFPSGTGCWILKQHLGLGTGVGLGLVCYPISCSLFDTEGPGEVGFSIWRRGGSIEPPQNWGGGSIDRTINQSTLAPKICLSIENGRILSSFLRCIAPIRQGLWSHGTTT